MPACPTPRPARMTKVALGHRPPEGLHMPSALPFCPQGATWSPRGPGGAGLPAAGGPIWGEASAGAPPCCGPCCVSCAALVAPMAGAQAGNSKVSLTGPCKLPANITVRAAKRWSTNPGASSAPTPKGRGGAPSTATKAAGCGTAQFALYSSPGPRSLALGASPQPQSMPQSVSVGVPRVGMFCKLFC
jgi:hypothetical protein